MVLPFTLSACRTALWPFLRHWQWFGKTHEEKHESENGLGQDKRRQVTSSINCSRLLVISRHQCNVTIDNCKGSLVGTWPDKWFCINDGTNEFTNLLFPAHTHKMGSLLEKKGRILHAPWKWWPTNVCFWERKIKARMSLNPGKWWPMQCYFPSPSSIVHCLVP